MPNQPRSNFRFDSKSIFLTYPQAEGLTFELIADKLKEVGFNDYVIAQENHQDGNIHFHAFAERTSKFRSRNERVFDINDKHPNIQSPRSRKDVIKYVTKDNNYITSEGFVLNKTKRKYCDILQDSKTKEEFYSGILQEYSRDYVLHNDAIVQFAEKHFKKDDTYVPRYTEFTVPPLIQDWLDTEFVNPGKWLFFGRPRHRGLLSFIYTLYLLFLNPKALRA